MTARQAASFATHRPDYWQQVAAHCAHDFLSYQVFVHGYLPAPPHEMACPTCGGEPAPGSGRCDTCEGSGVYVIPSHHEVIAERLLYGERLELILGPPDTAKSTYGVGFAEWTLGRNPNWRWLIASEVAAGIATTIVTQIGETISDNERFHLVFGELRDPRGKGEWSSHSVRLRTHISPQEAKRSGRPVTPPPPPWLLVPEPDRPPRVTPIFPQRGRRPGLAHPNVKAVGWRTGYTGVRAEGLIADDLVSDKSSRSQLVTETVFRTLHQKMLARLTGDQQRAILFGQRWAPRDLYGMLLEHATVCYDSNPHREGVWVLDRELSA